MQLGIKIVIHSNKVRGKKEVCDGETSSDDYRLMGARFPRYGVFAEIENLTYSVLRRYGIEPPTQQHSPSSVEQAA